MTNLIAKDTLNIKNNLIVKGTVYIIESKEGLDKLENLETFQDVSGDFDNLEVDGDLAICEYSCKVNIGEEMRSEGNMVLN